MQNETNGARISNAIVTMEKILKAAELHKSILSKCNTSEKANTLISKWNDGNLGPNPIDTAAALEARNQVFGWGR